MSEKDPDVKEKRPEGWEASTEAWADRSLEEAIEAKALIAMLTDDRTDQNGVPLGTIANLRHQRRATHLQYRIAKVVDGKASARTKSLLDDLYRLKCAIEQAQEILEGLQGKNGNP